MIAHRDSPPGRRHFRLGPLGLIADTGEEFARIQSWLPQASLPTEHAPAAAVWISKLPPPKDVVGKPLFDSGGIAVWIDEHHERATAIGVTAHAEIDLREKSGRVHAGTDDAELEQLLTLTVRLLLGRAGCLLVDATAIVEPDGGAWMILGAPKARTALACGFVFDGCQFVSDGQSSPIARATQRRAGSGQKITRPSARLPLRPRCSSATALSSSICTDC
jgi:hypothetical protein